jgi:hypothetical protein
MIRLRPVPRRVGPQQRVIARQLSGLSVSRTQLLLLPESFEHSIWGPFGVKLMADQGRVALTRGDLGFSHLKHSFAGGLTLRAGGSPMIFLMFAWGGPEGHHNIVNMNTSLLGGSSRPALD